MFYLKIIKEKTISVHKLVAICFLGHNDSNGLVVDHINEIKSDNNVNNLQLVTSRENTSRSINKNLPTGVRNYNAKFTSTISYNGKNKHLGNYDTPEQASDVYQRALKLINEGNVDLILNKYCLMSEEELFLIKNDVESEINRRIYE